MSKKQKFMLDRPVPKLSKQAKRKQGWGIVKDAVKDMYVDSTKRILRGGAEMAANSRKGAKHLGEVGGAGLVGIAKTAVKELPRNVGNVGKIGHGVFRGLFNHPDWFKYKGELSIPAHNAERPFSPTAIKAIQSNPWVSGRSGKFDGAADGVTHFIQVSLTSEDIRSEEYFKLATIEAFKAIRLDLKSNLPYTQTSYDNYIQMVCSVFMKAKMIEKLLGNYNYTRADIPEYARASQTVPFNVDERGIITPRPIKMLTEGEYATTLNNFKKLKSIINNIAIPSKLSEFISWWIGSQFIDQAAKNPQIYSCYLRDSITYHTEDREQLDVFNQWDVATGSVQDVIDEALNLLDVFGIMNADIIKTGRYGTCNVVLPDNYQPVFLCDYEFFSILINAYTNVRTDSVMTAVNNPEYIRVDALEELNDANLVGMANALATWADFKVLFKIHSQAAYFSVDSTIDLPAGINGSVASSTEFKVTNEVNGCFVQIGYNATNVESIITHTSAGTRTATASMDSRLSDTDIGNATSLSLTVPHTILIVGNEDYRDLIYTSDSNGHTICLRWIRSTNALVVYDATAASVLGTLSSIVCTITGGGHAVDITAGTATITTTLPYAKWFAADRAIYTVDSVNFTFSVAYTVSAALSVEYSSDAYEYIPWFIDQVDYHLPVLYQRNTVLYCDSTQTGQLVAPPMLLKECYKPLIFNYADISTVLYWMHLGLFAMM